jgi:hypothetical protein
MISCGLVAGIVTDRRPTRSVGPMHLCVIPGTRRGGTQRLRLANAQAIRGDRSAQHGRVFPIDLKLIKPTVHNVQEHVDGHPVAVLDLSLDRDAARHRRRRANDAEPNASVAIEGSCLGIRCLDDERVATRERRSEQDVEDRARGGLERPEVVGGMSWHGEGVPPATQVCQHVVPE